jgi:hypothetical protein
MLAFPAGFKIHLTLAPVDMRKQFNGLWVATGQTLRMDPRQGAVFVFTNKTRDLLYWDGTGVQVLANTHLRRAASTGRAARRPPVSRSDPRRSRCYWPAST